MKSGSIQNAAPGLCARPFSDAPTEFAVQARSLSSGYRSASAKCASALGEHRCPVDDDAIRLPTPPRRGVDSNGPFIAPPATTRATSPASGAVMHHKRLCARQCIGDTLWTHPVGRPGCGANRRGTITVPPGPSLMTGRPNGTPRRCHFGAPWWSMPTAYSKPPIRGHRYHSTQLFG